MHTWPASLKKPRVGVGADWQPARNSPDRVPGGSQAWVCRPGRNGSAVCRDSARRHWQTPAGRLSCPRSLPLTRTTGRCARRCRAPHAGPIVPAVAGAIPAGDRTVPRLSGTLSYEWSIVRKECLSEVLIFEYKAPETVVCPPVVDRRVEFGAASAWVCPERGSANSGYVRVWSWSVWPRRRRADNVHGTVDSHDAR